MTEVAAAQELILGRMPVLPSIALALETCEGRILAEHAQAERDQPPFDRVTMDGIAIAFRDWQNGVRHFARRGVQAAGVPALALGETGQCVEVMTGAMRPTGADTVIPVERITLEDGFARVQDDAGVEQHQFIHPQGSDGRRGARLITAGTRLGPPELAVLASAGYSEVHVVEQARVAVISTGDELVGPRDPIEPYQIRSTNDFAIAASLESRGLAKVTRARLKDDERELLDSIERLYAGHDLLILSGGVSMGQFDLVPAVLERLGAELVFHRIEQKPGRPMWFGFGRSGKPIFALPGNPVSTLVCTARYIVPALERAAHRCPAAEERVRLTADVAAPSHLTYFLPVKLDWSAHGEVLAEPRPTNTSGDFISLAGTDGFVELPKGRALHAAGTVARLYRW